jgi:hypothetical protein
MVDPSPVDVARGANVPRGHENFDGTAKPFSQCRTQAVLQAIALAWRCTGRYLTAMCGRVIQSSGPIRYAIVEGIDVPASTTIRRAGMPRRARSSWSSGAIIHEWRAIKGQKAKQPYAIAMKDGQPFRIGGLWENWKDPTSGEWIPTFTVITTDANELVAEIHDRMPLVLAPEDYNRWLSDEPDPRDLLRPFPAEPKPENYEPSLLDPVVSSAA